MFARNSRSMVTERPAFGAQAHPEASPGPQFGGGTAAAGRAVMTALLAALAAGCAADMAPARPDREAILRQVVACGLTAENATFSVDEEGVDNADIAPAGETEAAYRAGVDCLMQWAAQSGAAMGFDVSEGRRP